MMYAYLSCRVSFTKVALCGSIWVGVNLSVKFREGSKSKDSGAAGVLLGRIGRSLSSVNTLWAEVEARHLFIFSNIKSIVGEAKVKSNPNPQKLPGSLSYFTRSIRCISLHRSCLRESEILLICPVIMIQIIKGDVRCYLSCLETEGRTYIFSFNVSLSSWRIDEVGAFFKLENVQGNCKCFTAPK